MDNVRSIPPSAVPSTAVRLDRALDRMLGGAPNPVEGEFAPLVRIGSALAAALHPIPAGERYATQLWGRLARPGPGHRLSEALASLVTRHRPPAWLLVTGAVSSAAVGAGITAFALRRGTRHPGMHAFVPSIGRRR